jgi:hypothetical protein
MLAQFSSILSRFGTANCHFLQVAYRMPRKGEPVDDDSVQESPESQGALFSYRRIQICESVESQPELGHQ